MKINMNDIASPGPFIPGTREDIWDHVLTGTFVAARRFFVAYAVLVALVVWQLSSSLLRAVAPSSQGLDFGMMWVTLLILAGLFLVPYRAGGIVSHPIEDKPHAAPEGASLDRYQMAACDCRAVMVKFQTATYARACVLLLLRSSWLHIVAGLALHPA